MSHAYVMYLSGKGEPPTSQELAEAKRKRAVADDLFGVALNNWREAGRGPL